MTLALTGRYVAHAAPPASVSNHWTVAATLAGVATGSAIVFWWSPDGDSRLASLLLMACVFVPGVFVEMFVNMSPERSGLEFAWKKVSWLRVCRKLAALWAIFATLAALYAMIPLYAGDDYADFRWLLSTFGWLLVLASVPYVAATDTFQTNPEDALSSLGKQLTSLSFRPTATEINYLLGWLVKGFFLPLMFCFLVKNLEFLRSVDLSTHWSLSSYLYDVSYNGLFFVDVLVGAVGYASTLKLLGTDIRSTDPTVFGWVVALICYPPFWTVFVNSYFPYGHDRPWGMWLADHPVLYAVWGASIIFCLFIYVWATVVFGIRFSNLTNRGIITNGPYRWTKHPAYIAKNASWWLISVPFFPPDGSILTALKLSLMLCCVNLVYYLRARTEERHLSHDPVYRAYSEYIRQHGLLRLITR